MSLYENFLIDRIETLENRVSSLEKQATREEQCKHDGGYIQLAGSDYEKCRKCGMAVPRFRS